MLAFAIGLSAQNNMSLDQIRDNWSSKSIKLENASQANIMDFVTAFQKTWPTYSGRELIKFSKSKLPYENTDKVVDLKNGYVLYMEDDPEAVSDEHMEACFWNRKNGHKLLAVTISRVTPSELVVLCFYDYDPNTQTLTPEKSLNNLFTPSFPGYRYRAWLPQKGKNLVIEEFFGSITIKHTYSWDGMKPTNPKTTIDQLGNCQAQFNADYFGANENPFTQYAMLDIDHDGRPELVLRANDESFRAVVIAVAKAVSRCFFRRDRSKLMVKPLRPVGTILVIFRWDCRIREHHRLLVVVVHHGRRETVLVVFRVEIHERSALRLPA